MKRLMIASLAVVLPALVASAAPNYNLNWHSVNGGGENAAASASYKMGMSAGQSAAGEATSPSYHMGIGFWHGARTCFCPCFGDPFCDGIRSSVQDVVKTIDVAFRGVAPVFDQACPREQTDVNCDGSTSVQDVVKEVNVAFRGGNAATEFCQPCP
ncbi:MAG: hypothetical protein AB1792_00800 [Candidatus Zixiibacteriota bacterium]